MKIIITALYLYFSLFATYGAFAANNSLLSDYPAPSGSYNKITIAPQPTTLIPCTTANAGLLFLDPATNTIQLCSLVTIGGTPTPTVIPYGQTCFNRFWAGGGSAPPIGCPAGYTQGVAGKIPVDNFTLNGAYNISSSVCCSASTVQPQ